MVVLVVEVVVLVVTGTCHEPAKLLYPADAPNRRRSSMFKYPA
jgi:hypothetical protein